MTERTGCRADHLVWCKERACAYLDQGDVNNAWSSFVSDMMKHEETRDHKALQLGMMLLLTGNLGSVQKMREFIEGFH